MSGTERLRQLRNLKRELDGSVTLQGQEGEAINVPYEVQGELSFNYIVLEQLRNTLLASMLDYESFERQVLVLLKLIPRELYDEQFLKEIEGASFKVREGTGQYVGHGGSLREVERIYKTYNYFDLIGSICSLLRRRGLYWKTSSTEVVP